jgi:protein-S-isoprenylcysteine O-methyltransferase Ste14
MVVSALGLALALRSPWGLIGVFLLFAPAGAYRAMLEDKALAQQFGPQWSQYADRTFFMFPPLW